MDFQKIVDSFHSMTCVVSVERKNSSGYGELRLIAGNKLFIDMVEHPVYITDPNAPSKKFVPNSLYDIYLPKAPDFESMCYRSAVLKKTVHTYMHPNMTDLWFALYTIPLECDEEDVSYCIYSTEQCSINDIELAPSGSQGIANDVLKTCIRLRGAGDFRKAMNEVINDISIICDASVCTLMLMDIDQGRCSVLAASRKENSSVRSISDQDNIYDIAVSWIDTINEGDCVIINNDKDMEYLKGVNYLWYKALVESGVSSIVLFPLRHNKELLGYIWASNFDTENSRRIKDTLELTTFFLSSEIASYNMMQQLERISYTDILTGTLNRNAMNNKVSSIVSEKETMDEPYGIVFADLNGLKAVNDKKGHTAGDLILKKAALLLQEIFIGDQIYRAGGDEFMVIVSGCSEEEFDNKVAKLRERSADPEKVCFSVGSFYNSSDSVILDAMRIADQAMYKDKEQYYLTHPERRNR